MFSCANDTFSKVVDDFSYISVNSFGKIEKIGNNSGKISTIPISENLFSSNSTYSNSIAYNSEKIFIKNYSTLYVFDRKTNTSVSKILTYPKEMIIGTEPSMTSMIWDESKKTLYGIVIADIYNNSMCYFVKINTTTLDINYTGLSFNQRGGAYSAFLNGNKIYSSSDSHLGTGNTIEIDIDSNTAKQVLFNNSNISFIRAASYINNTAICIRDKNDGSFALCKINLNDNSYEDLLLNESLNIFTPTGNGFIDKSTNEYICFLEVNAQFRILKYNIITKKYTILELNNYFDEDISIIDKVAN